MSLVAIFHSGGRPAWGWRVAALPLLYLWWLLINQLRIPWSTNPQYAYGWAVPFLCAYLLWERFQPSKFQHRTSKFELKAGEFQLPTTIFFILFALCALLYAPTRLVQEASPEWALVNWTLAGQVIGLTLLTVRFALGPLCLAHCAFPICFFLVAVPWPYSIENPVIQGLTRMDTALTIEILGLIGIPAIQHGNVIELATGSVGIDEACSGIRSLQATLMLSLFFGEFYRLSATRRVVCIFSGFALALACNLGRMLLLTWVAARRGEQAIAGWHDPAGVSILVACFIGLWLVGLALRRKEEVQSPESKVQSPTYIRPERILLAFVGLAVWLVAVEISVAAWYHHVESNLPDSATWSMVWPETESSFRELPIATKAAEMLRYDSARQVQWIASNGTRWQLSWFYWKPGKTAGYLAKSHNPLVCMPAAGYGVSSVSPVQTANIHGLRLPFRIYCFEQEGSAVYILYSRWDDRAMEQPFATEDISRLNRLRSVWRGRGNHGQRVVSMAVWGAHHPDQAKELLLGQLDKVVAVGTP